MASIRGIGRHSHSVSRDGNTIADTHIYGHPNARTHAHVNAIADTHKTTTATPSPSPTPTPEPAVRILYAVPSDRDIEPHYTTAVSNAVHNLQRWYAEQMNGYTFAIESPTPQICAVDQKAAYYEGVGGWNRVIDSVQDCSPVEHSSERHVWVIYIDAEFDCSNTTGEARQRRRRHHHPSPRRPRRAR